MVRSCRLPADGSLSWRRRCWLPGAPRPPPGAQGQGEGEGGGGVVGSKLLQRHQRQEVDRAGLEGLCCDEAEKTEGVRKEIEEKLTEAMIRQCWRQPGKSWPCTAPAPV